MLKLKKKIDNYNYCEVTKVHDKDKVRCDLLEVENYGKKNEEIVHTVANAIILKSNIKDYKEVK